MKSGFLNYIIFPEPETEGDARGVAVNLKFPAINFQIVLFD